MSRVRIVAVSLATLAIVYGAGSIRRLGRTDRRYVLDFPALGTPPRLLAPGRHFAPRFIGRISEYPAAPRKLRVDLSGARAAASREGARVEVEAELTYSVPEDRVLELHHARGPRYETDWLAGLLRGRTTATLATSSYDLVRSRDPELTRAVRASLSDEVAAAGLRIEGFRLVQVAAVGESAGAILRVGSEPIHREVVVIGVDSFDWRIIGPLMRQGRMPALAALVARGARANLKTIRPILSPVIWTSIATGMKPSRHGIVDFVVNARDTGALVPVTSAMRQVPALWTLLSRQGIDVSVVAWWATWPAETVRGSVVTDRIAFQLFNESIREDWKSADPARSRGKTYPPDLFGAIRGLIRAPSDVSDDEVLWFLPKGTRLSSLTRDQLDQLNEFRTVIAAGETYHAIALERFRASGKALKMVYYEGPDTTSHLFMHYRPPLLPGVERRDMELLGGVVDRYYEKQDRFIGEIAAAAGADATILVVSDHGFKSDSNRPPRSDPSIGKGNAVEWHTPVGVLVAAGPDIRKGFDLGSASILDVAPTILSLYGLPAARDMDGQPLTEALTPGFLADHAVSWIDSYGGVRPPLEEAETVDAAGNAELLEKLRNLGYIGEERMTAHNNRGVIALDEGDVNGAIAEFEKALAGGDQGAMVRTNLSRAWLTKGDLDKAQSFAAQALRDDPDNKLALALLAGVLMKRGDVPAAEAQLRRAIAIDPTFVQGRSKLGEILQKTGREDEALAEFRKVVEIAPLSPLEHNNIGNIHRRRRQLDRAMQAYREALRCDAQYIGAYNNLGLCLQELGRLEEAKALYDKALLIRPENPVLRNSLGTLLSLRGDRDGAIAEFRRAVESDPDWPVAQGNLATLLFEAGRPREAREAFESWARVEPSSIDARLGLGLTLLMLQEKNGAVGQFEEVLKLDPDNFRAHTALGETYLKGGDLDKAEMHLMSAVRLAPDIPRVYNDLGELYLGRGLKKEAQAAFRKSLSLEPGQDEVRRLLLEAGR